MTILLTTCSRLSLKSYETVHEQRATKYEKFEGGDGGGRGVALLLLST